MPKEKIQKGQNTIEIGKRRYTFTPEIQQFLRPTDSSKYAKNTSAIIIGEPHESSEAQFNLMKGLELFFSANPELIKQTIFLSEGTAANKSISVQELVEEEPHPSDDIIKLVLQSHLITGYIAYEWKHQQGIPIEGTENDGLYALCRRFMSLCRENPLSAFQHFKNEDGTEFDVPLMHTLAFAIAARNKPIAQTLIEKVRVYHNPMLFVDWGHVKDERSRSQRKWDQIIKKDLIQAQYRGPIGPLLFPWSMEGEDWWLYRYVSEDTETLDIHYYLEQAKIGYTFLEPKGIKRETAEDKESYKRIFRAQR